MKMRNQFRINLIVKKIYKLYNKMGLLSFENIFLNITDIYLKNHKTNQNT